MGKSEARIDWDGDIRLEIGRLQTSSRNYYFWVSLPLRLYADGKQSPKISRSSEPSVKILRNNLGNINTLNINLSQIGLIKLLVRFQVVIRSWVRSPHPLPIVITKPALTTSYAKFCYYQDSQAEGLTRYFHGIKRCLSCAVTSQVMLQENEVFLADRLQKDCRSLDKSFLLAFEPTAPPRAIVYFSA